MKPVSTSSPFGCFCFYIFLFLTSDVFSGLMGSVSPILDLKVRPPAQADLSYPPPRGVLRVLVKSGAQLRAADLNLSGASSDPYVVIEVGAS